MSEDIKKYKIYRWDAVLFGRNINPNPIVYVKPDEKLLSFARENSNALMLNISGSESIYDGKNIPGIFMKSSDVPNCRSNFFKKTGLYVIVLTSEWHGYPDCLGDCSIFGLTGGVYNNKKLRNIDIHEVAPSSEQYNNDINRYSNNYIGMDSSRIIAVSVGLIVILITILFICKK